MACSQSETGHAMLHLLYGRRCFHLGLVQGWHGDEALTSTWKHIHGAVGTKLRSCSPQCANLLQMDALQVVERLSKASEKRDLLVLNFGLHFSETYKEELEQLVQQVGDSRCGCALYAMACRPRMHAMHSLCTSRTQHVEVQLLLSGSTMTLHVCPQPCSQQGLA